jgi:hypothetical protein
VATAKLKTEAKTEAGPKPVAGLVDELGRIEHKLEPYRLDIAREDALRKQIRERYDASPANQAFAIEGAEFTGAVGERGLVTVIDNVRAYKALGQKAFVAAANLTLAALERTKTDLAGIVRKEQTGTRSLRIFRKAA